MKRSSIVSPPKRPDRDPDTHPEGMGNHWRSQSTLPNAE